MHSEGCSVHDFDNLSKVHDNNLLAEILHKGKVVTDKQNRIVCFILMLLQECHDFLLNRHIQSTGGLITDQNLRMQCNGSCNGNSLQLAPGQLMGIFVKIFLTEINTFQGIIRHLSGFFFTLLFEMDPGLHQKSADLHSRTEYIGRILKNHLDISAVLTEFFPPQCNIPAILHPANRLIFIIDHPICHRFKQRYHPGQRTFTAA